MKRILLLLALVVLAGCSKLNESAARNILENVGYTEINLGSRASNGACGHGESSSLEFWAKGPTGRPLHGVLCGTSGGAVTIRYF